MADFPKGRIDARPSGKQRCFRYENSRREVCARPWRDVGVHRLDNLVGCGFVRGAVLGRYSPPVNLAMIYGVYIIERAAQPRAKLHLYRAAIHTRAIMVPLRAVAINKPRGKNFTYSIGHCFQFQTSIFTPTRQNCYTLMWGSSMYRDTCRYAETSGQPIALSRGGVSSLASRACTSSGARLTLASARNSNTAMRR